MALGIGQVHCVDFAIAPVLHGVDVLLSPCVHRNRFDLGDVNAYLSMDATASHANEASKRVRRPFWIRSTTVATDGVDGDLEQLGEDALTPIHGKFPVGHVVALELVFALRTEGGEGWGCEWDVRCG